MSSCANLLRRPETHNANAPVVSFDHVTVRYDGAPPRSKTSRSTFGRASGWRSSGRTARARARCSRSSPASCRLPAAAADVYGYGAGGHICIGYVPQRSNVDWTFPVSVADVVMMGRVAKIGILRQAGRGDWQRVRDALAQVGMEQFAERQIGELSGGQQQRVFIARALAQEAELLLMDEPLTGLDIPSQEAIFGILDQLKQQRHDRAGLDARPAAGGRPVRPADAAQARADRAWATRRGADAATTCSGRMAAT